MSSNILKDKLTKASEINIIKLNIISVGGVKIDVKNAFIELVIYENIFSNCVTGFINIQDKYNFTRNVPLIGRERIELEFKTPSTPTTIKKNFSVTEIQHNLRLPGKNETVLNLRFSSGQFDLDQSTKISKSYPNKKFFQIVGSIFDDYLKINETDSVFLVEDTSPPTSLVVPNWSPFQTINWITKHASYEENNDYLFFETLGGFFFIPVSYLKIQEPTAKFLYEPTTPFSSSIDNQFQRIESYFELSEGFKKAEMEFSGVFSSLLINFDTTNKDLSYKQFNYIEDFSNSFHRLEKNPIIPLSYGLYMSPSNKLIFSSNSKFVHNDTPLQTNPTNKQRRISQLLRMNDKLIKIDVPGDSRRRIGELVELIIPSTEFISVKPFTKVEDEYLSGKYIISAVGHHIVRLDGYYMGIEMMKDSYSVQLPDKTSVKGVNL